MSRRRRKYKKSNGANNNGRSGNSNSSDLTDQGLASTTKDQDKRLNDPKWYFASSTLADQASQLSFQNFVGEGPLFGEDTNKVPAVFNILLNPSPGNTFVPTDTVVKTTAGATDMSSVTLADSGANLMAKKLYTLLASNSGRVQAYAPQDVLSMILAISSVAEASETIRRIFGMVLTYNARNRYVPIGAIEAFGFNSLDLISNLADYRMRFNVEITRINQIPLLDNVGFIRKARDIYQYVYVDDASPMAQMFAYSPFSLWTIDEDSYEQGTILKTTPFVNCKESQQTYYDYEHTSDTKTMGEYIDILSKMIDELLNSNTLNIIYADLLNLATKMKVPTWQFDYLAENYAVLPIYNRNAMLQLHNLTVVGVPTAQGLYSVNNTVKITPNNDVYPDVAKNRLIYNPGFQDLAGNNTIINQWGQMQDIIVDIDSGEPTLEDRLEALRYASTYTGYIYRRVVNESYGILYNHCTALADHYAVAIGIGYQRRYSGGDSDNDYSIPVDRSWVSSLQSPVLSAFGKLDWAPFLYQFKVTTSGENKFCRVQYTHGDLNYFTTVDSKYINRLLRVIYTGLFEFRVGSDK